MSQLTVTMLTILGLAAAITLAVRLIPALGTATTQHRYQVDSERPNAALLRLGESTKLISLKFKSKPEQFDFVGTLDAAGESTEPPLPLILAPADSPLGRRMIGIADEAKPEKPESRWTLAKIKPWILFGGAIVVSIVVLSLARHVIINNKNYSADDLKAAWASVTAIMGFWVGKASS